jgi:hypothetical protein
MANPAREDLIDRLKVVIDLLGTHMWLQLEPAAMFRCFGGAHVAKAFDAAATCRMKLSRPG